MSTASASAAISAELGRREAEGGRVVSEAVDHRQTVADAATGVLGPDRQVGPQPFDILPDGDDPLDRPAERLRQVGAQPHLGGQLLGGAYAVGVQVDLPTSGVGVVESPVPQQSGGHRLSLRRRMEVLVRRRGGGPRPWSVHPAVRAEPEAGRVRAVRQGPESAPGESGDPGVDPVAGRVQGTAQHALQHRNRRRGEP